MLQPSNIFQKITGNLLIFHKHAQQNYFTSNLYKRSAHTNDFTKHKEFDIHTKSHFGIQI